MIESFKNKWKTYLKTKSIFGKISDLLFVLLVIGMLIPTTRKEISAFVAGILASSPKTIETAKQPVVPEAAYAWSFQTIDGKPVQFSSFKGKTIFLNFWATWCPPCIAEMPDMQDLYNQFGNKAVFLLITDEDPQKVEAFMKKRGFDMPVYINRNGVPEIFATTSIPTTYLIDPDGKVVIRKTGAAKWNSKSMIERMQALTLSSN